MAPSASQLPTDSFEFGNSAAQEWRGTENMGEGIGNGLLTAMGQMAIPTGYGSNGHLNGYGIFPLGSSRVSLIV